MEFSRPEYWSGYPFPSPGDLPNPGIEPRSPALQVDSLPAEPPGKPTVPRGNSIKDSKSWGSFNFQTPDGVVTAGELLSDSCKAPNTPGLPL